MIDAQDDFEQQNRFNRGMNGWRELPTYTQQLHELIGDTSAPVSDGGGTKNRGGGTSYRAPWNSGAAGLYFEIHAEIRHAETALTLALHHQATYRGGSDHATAQIFDRLPILMYALHEKDPRSEILADVFRDLGALTKRAHVALNPDERRTPAPHISCGECGGILWIYRAGHDVNPKIASDHFQPGDAYCNRCGIFYPLDIWEKVAKEKAHVA